MFRFRFCFLSFWFAILAALCATAFAQEDLTQPEIRQNYLRQAGRLMMQMDFERLRAITSAMRAAAERKNDKGTLAAALMFETVAYALRNKPLETLATYRKLPPLAELENDRRALVYVLNLRALISYFRDDFKQTRADAERSMSLSDPAADQIEIGLALAILSWVQIHDRQLDAAEAGLRRSLALFEQASEPVLSAFSLNNLGVIYETRDQREAALKHHHASLALSEQYGLRALRHYTLMNLGDTSIQLGQLAQALDYYQQCLAERRTRGNSRELATAWRSVAQAHQELNHFSEAIQAYEACLKVETALGDKRAAALRTYNIGGVYLRQEDFGHAIDALQRSLMLAETQQDAEIQGLAALDLSHAYSRLNQSALELDYAQRSLRAAEVAQDRTLLRMVWQRLVQIYGQLEQYQSAFAAWEKAAQYINPSLRDIETVNFCLLKVWLHLKRGEMDQAEAALREAHSINERLQHPLLIYQEAYWQSRWAQARGHHEQAINTAAQAVKLAEITQRDSLVFESHTQHGTLLRRTGRADEARPALEQAIAASERLRAGAIGNASQQAFTHVSLLAPYHEMVRLLVAQKNFAAAWNYAERAKGRALLNVLQQGRADNARWAHSLTAQEQAEEAQLETTLRSLNLEIANAQSDATRLAALEPQRQKARLALESFQTALYAKYPQLKTQRGEMQPLALDEAQRLLGDQQTAWLEYVVTDERTYLFVLALDASGKVAVQAHEIAITRQALTQQIARWQQQLAERDPAFRALARQLATLLLEPARAALANKTRLVIAPDEALWELSFQSLPLKSGPGERYLLESHTLSYTPSFTVLREMTQRRAAQRGTASLLAFGNPALPSDMPANAATFRRNTELAPLPAAEREVKTLGQLYGTAHSKIFIGTAAREAEAKRAAGQFDILHFATHGVLNNANPMYSHLLLAPAPDGKDGEDGLLEAREVMRLDLHAELVVLSACETARGKIGAGEGVIGLSWAFFVAGAPATLVSQWKVESLSTTDLMLNFYRQRQGATQTITKAAALRQAALNLMRRPEYKHPFYWAGFVLIGDGR